ncbi:MAG TPA: GAF domain-containing sensor histidine kinase [Anaerolineales bacterium]|nr:GAF domain-containing sensor histidine kinase [Anaerolineales bacterium]
MLARPPAQLAEALARLRWQLPALIAVVGLAYAVGDHVFLARYESIWPHLLLGAFVLGLIGPVFAWRTLTWAALAARERDEAARELRSRNDQCSVMNAIAHAVNRSLDLDEVLDLALDKTLELMRLEAGEFRMVEDSHLVLRVHRGVSREAIAGSCEVHLGECLCGAAAAKGELMAVDDLGESDSTSLPWCRTQHYRAVLSLPIQSKGRVSGVLHLASRAPREFTSHDRQMLASIGHQIGVAVEKASLHAEVNRLNFRLQQRVESQATELEGAKGEIADKAQQLQQLLVETMSLQEKERARIAYDMHDQAVQLIVGTVYQIQAARQCVAEDSDVAVILQTAQTLLKQLETEIRQAIYDLRPPALDSLGLVPALREYADRFRRLAGFAYGVSYLGVVCRLPVEAEVAVYRIVQEALHNVARHADATRTEVLLDFRGPNLVVTVSDDGHGFDSDEALAQNTRHLGLISMRERALALRGELRLMARPGQGTRLVLTVPMWSLPDMVRDE